MTKKYASNRLLALLAITLPLIGGCVSIVKSTPATKTSKGLRYSLPVPVLQVTPQPDGTMSIDVLYLPDPKNTYAINAYSFLGNYTLDVHTKNGILETVSFNPDSTGVATQAISTYGDISKAKIDAVAKADVDALKKADDKAKAAVTAAQDLTKAKITLAVAIAKRDKLIELGSKKDDSSLINAELAIVEAQLKFDALIAEAMVDASSNSMNKAANAQSQFDLAAGPIFYRMVTSNDNSGRVDLIPDAVQVHAKTSKPVKASPKKPELAFSFFDSDVIRPGKNGLVMKIKVNQPIFKIAEEEVKLEADDHSATIKPVRVTKNVVSGDTYINVVFDDHQALGKYKLKIPVVLEKDGGPINADLIKFEIRLKVDK